MIRFCSKSSIAKKNFFPLTDRKHKSGLSILPFSTLFSLHCEKEPLLREMNLRGRNGGGSLNVWRAQISIMVLLGRLVIRRFFKENTFIEFPENAITLKMDNYIHADLYRNCLRIRE